MSKVLDRTGVGAALNVAQHDSNLSSLSGINEAVAGATYSVTIDDQNRTLEFTGTGCTVTLPQMSTITAALHTDDFKVTFISTGTGTVTINKNAADTFNTGATSLTLRLDEYITLQTDSTGTVWNIISNNRYVINSTNPPDFSVLFDRSSAQRILGFTNAGSENIYFYGEVVGTNYDVGLYDAKNTRGVWNYDESANTFSITPPLSNTSSVLTTPTLNGAIAGSTIQVGTVNDTGAIIRQSGSVTPSRTGTGRYTLTHNLGTLDYSLFVMTADANTSAAWSNNTGTAIQVSINNNSGVATDAVFFFQLIQY